MLPFFGSRDVIAFNNFFCDVVDLAICWDLGVH